MSPGAILDDVLAAVGADPAGDGDEEVTLRGADPLFPTPPRVGELGAAAIAAAALAAARVLAQRTGTEQQVTVDVDAAAAAMRSWTYLADAADAARTPGGDGPQLFFETGDGRWVFLHRRAAHHAARQERVLGSGPSDHEVAEAVRRWKGAELEEAVVAADACAALVRSHAEWAAHEQAAAVAQLPLLEVTKINDSDPEPAGSGGRPLGGVRVLDVTHVLAGPTCARTLAEHGADVLRIGMSPAGDRNPMQRDTGHGKRSAVLDLKRADGASALRTLIGGADVFSQGYRPGALTALGFAPEVAAALRPGIIYVSMSAFGTRGPWQDRRGYDSVVQSVSGFCDEVAVDGQPRFLPVSALDYVTGYLAAFGVCIALARRAAGGGSYHVRLSLAQTGRYLAGLPRTSVAERAGLAAELPTGRLAELLTETDTPFGRLRHLAPAARMSATPPRWDRPTVPMNHDSPSWELTRRYGQSGPGCRRCGPTGPRLLAGLNLIGCLRSGKGELRGLADSGTAVGAGARGA
jgi:crotonobetainyl-CoA:carnitine CoA-transferase CaiB-like acyl-CoA transferase